jgi:hypothetical protein
LFDEEFNNPCVVSHELNTVTRKFCSKIVVEINLVTAIFISAQVCKDSKGKAIPVKGREGP